MFKSNLFRLQIDELLGEVRMKAKRTAVVETALRSLKGALDEIKDAREEVEVRACAARRRVGG